MLDDLERECARLLQRLEALQLEHEALHQHPDDLPAHEAHRRALLDYQAEVRAYRQRLIAERG